MRRRATSTSSNACAGRAAFTPTAVTRCASHAAGTACGSATGLATSADGRRWHWEGGILAPAGDGWDRYCARIGCVWYQAPVWLALYDGSAGVSENYEERCGLAFSQDLRYIHRVSRQQP